MTRNNYSSGSPWEEKVGYSRAVKIGPFLEVTGTVAVNEKNEVVGLNNPYEQTRFILDRIENVLIHAGFGLKDVIRTRLFVTDISKWEEYGRAHGEYFKDIKPCTTMVEVNKLIGPDYLVEMEVSAILES